MRTLLRLSPVLLLAACTVVEGNGQVVTEPRTLVDFDRVVASSSVDVEVFGGAEDYRVAITCDRNLIAYIQTAVDSGELEVRVQDDVWMEPTQPCLASIAVPGDVRALHATGSGDVTAGHVGGIEEIGTSGSGDARVGGIDTDRLTLAASGSGDVIVQGVADQLRASTSGSGDIRAKELTARRAEARSTGSGDIVLTATEHADAHTSGSGDVHVHGDPDTVERGSSGSGDVVVH